MTLTQASRWAPMLAVRMRRSSIRCRESRSPRRMLWEPPCRAFQTILTCQPIGPTRPMKRWSALGGGFNGPSRPDTALCPLISRGWRPVEPVRRLRDLSHCRQLGSSWPGLQPRCSSIGGQGSPVPKRWAIAGPRLSPPPTGRPKTTKSTLAVGGAYPYIPNRSLRASRPPRPASQLLIGTSSRQISNAYLGGNLSLAAVLRSIAFWGYSGFGPFPSSEPSPRTARLQRIIILAKYALRLSC